MDLEMINDNGFLEMVNENRFWSNW